MFTFDELKQKCANKKFLITGHTGFKGSYLVSLLKLLDAKIYGYSLAADTDSIFNVAKIKNELDGEVIADIREYDKLYKFIKEVNPDYIIHMAAQALVLTSYEEPKMTYEVNVIGTVNLFEAIRNVKNELKDNINLKSVLNVTTDKVYENNDLDNYAFKENEKLCGFDPYSNSKSCSELVTYSYKNSFFSDNVISISTARAGNVIGGGDTAKNRIIPDCFRAIKNKEDVVIRNKYSVRPYQYVLEPLIIYLNILLQTSEDKNLIGSYNIGPDLEDCISTFDLVSKFEKVWNENETFNQLSVKFLENEKNKLHEAKFLRLDNNLIKQKFGYRKLYNMDKCIMNTASIYKKILKNENLCSTDLVADIKNIIL